MQRLASLRFDLIDLLPVGVFWKDLHFTYLGCNKYHAERVGLNPKDVVGKTDYELTWCDLADKYRKDDQQVMSQEGATKQFCFEERIRSSDNKVIWVRTIKLPLFDDYGSICGVLGIWQDISEYKEMIDSLATAFDGVVAKTARITDQIERLAL